MKVTILLCLTALFFSSTAHSVLIGFETGASQGDVATSISAGGVTLTFTNLEYGVVPQNGNGFGGPAGSNQVIPADQANFNGLFLTAQGFGTGVFRTSGFVRTIDFDSDVSDVNMYVADIDSGEGITARALDGSNTVLATQIFPASLNLNSRLQLIDFGALGGIRSVELVGDDPIGIDNLSFESAAVPAPAPALLLMVGLLGAGCRRMLS
tara:strand:+ start:238 stop:867 length:630 start_codon:yes stop_codon:yes gene_type:complete